MNEIQEQPQSDRASTKMLLTMGIVGLVASVLIVSTFRFTQPYIKHNEAEYLEQSIFEILPGTTHKKVFTINDKDRIVPLKNEALNVVKIYAGYNDSNQLVGLALEARDQGFQDVIRLIFGYSPEKQEIIGMKVLESTETPGLGDKIQSDPKFRSNFDSLDVRLDDSGKHLVTPIELIKSDKKTNRAQISAITGATISSRAVTRMIVKSVEKNIPIIYKQLDVFQKDK